MNICRAVKDFEWLGAHYSKLQEKYPSVYVAVKDSRVVAYDKEFRRVYDEARERLEKIL